MKKIFFPFALMMLMLVGGKDEDTTTSHSSGVIGYNNEWVLESGDILYFSDEDIGCISNIEVEEGAATETSGIKYYVEDIFDYTFTIDDYLYDEIEFVAQIAIDANSEDWSLCIVEDEDLWSEVYGATFDQASGMITAQITAPISDQERADNSFTVRFALVEMGEIITDVEVEQNPSNLNPLSAVISFESRLNATSKMTLVGQDNNDIVKDFSSSIATTKHEIEVLGLYNNYTNQVYIDSTFPSWGITLRKEYQLEVNHKYLYAFDVSVLSRSASLNNATDEIYITGGTTGSGTGYYDEGDMKIASIGFDAYGKVRWMYRVELSGNLRPYPIVYEGEKAILVTDLKSNPKVVISDYMGNILETCQTSGVEMLHHEGIYVGDGIIAVAETKNDLDESLFLEINVKTGAIEDTIDLDDIIDPDRTQQTYGASGEDRVHVNALYYDSDDDCYIVSMREQGVIKIRRGATSEDDIVWWMTSHTDVGEEWERYLLEPTNFVNTTENWNSGQHAVSLLDNGDILMFDNHDQPLYSYQSSSRVSRFLQMRVDEENMTVENIYQWQTPSKDYSQYMSNVLMTSSGESLISCWSMIQTIYEISYPDGDVLFKAQYVDSENPYRIYKTTLYE